MSQKDSFASSGCGDHDEDVSAPRARKSKEEKQKTPLHVIVRNNLDSTHFGRYGHVSGFTNEITIERTGEKGTFWFQIQKILPLVKFYPDEARQALCRGYAKIDFMKSAYKHCCDYLDSKATRFAELKEIGPRSELAAPISEEEKRKHEEKAASKFEDHEITDILEMLRYRVLIEIHLEMKAAAMETLTSLIEITSEKKVQDEILRILGSIQDESGDSEDPTPEVHERAEERKSSKVVQEEEQKEIRNLALHSLLRTAVVDQLRGEGVAGGLTNTTFEGLINVSNHWNHKIQSQYYEAYRIGDRERFYAICQGTLIFLTFVFLIWAFAEIGSDLDTYVDSKEYIPMYQRGLFYLKKDQSRMCLTDNAISFENSANAFYVKAVFFNPGTKMLLIILYIIYFFLNSYRFCRSVMGLIFERYVIYDLLVESLKKSSVVTVITLFFYGAIIPVNSFEYKDCIESAIGFSKNIGSWYIAYLASLVVLPVFGGGYYVLRKETEHLRYYMARLCAIVFILTLALLSGLALMFNFMAMGQSQDTARMFAMYFTMSLFITRIVVDLIYLRIKRESRYA